MRREAHHDAQMGVFRPHPVAGEGKSETDPDGIIKGTSAHGM